MDKLTISCGFHDRLRSTVEWIRLFAGYWEILFLFDGKLQISFNEKQITWSADDHKVLIYKPGIAYHFKGFKGAKYAYLRFNLRTEIEQVIKISGSVIDGLECFTLDQEMYERMKENIQEINKYLQFHLLKYDLLAMAMVETILLRVTDYADSSSSAPFKLAKAYALLTQPDNLSMPEIAQKCGLSISAFYQAFKKETGTSPNMYREQLKMIDAAILLQETDLSLSEIAKELNIYDQYYLSKRFRKYYNESPSVYRKKNRETSNNPKRDIE